MLRRFGYVLAALAAVYLPILGGVLALVLQPPARLALGIARIPEPLFVIVPFGQLWSFARAGHLRVSDPAPDFLLETLDGKGQVQLSSFRGLKPVVLVFGSYT
jgi:hypothetical protein